MFQAFIPHPLSPEVNIGDVIVFLALFAMFAIVVTKGGRNGR